jgi:hypothetical protein
MLLEKLQGSKGIGYPITDLIKQQNDFNEILHEHHGSENSTV